MSIRKTRKLIGACALMASAAALWSGDASAATTIIYGGGSSLVAPYWRQAMDCYGHPTALLVTAPATAPSSSTKPFFNYTGTPAQDCSETHISPTTQVDYTSTGSGTGIKAFYSGDPTLWGLVNSHASWPSVQYGMSDTSLAAPDVDVYNSGGTEQGKVFVAPGVTPTPGTNYANPKQKFGKLIQFPVSVDPVAIAYDPVYQKINPSGTVISLKFNVNKPGADGSGGLRMDKTTYCKIMAGVITDFNDPALKALNAGISLEDPADPTPSGSWSVPIILVGRSDGSGTTSIFTRAMAEQCASVLGSNPYADSTSTLPAGVLSGASYDGTTVTGAEAVGKFTIASGSGKVAKYIAFSANVADPTMGNSTVVRGRIGYIGPDYALPAVTNTGADPYTLNMAALKNPHDGLYYEATGANALKAFGTLRPPQSNADGTYNSASTDRNRHNPQDWVEPPSKFSVLANPTKGYPIVGTTNALLYTCYSTTAKTKAVIGAFNWYTTSKTVSDPKKGLLALSGLAPLPAAWNLAINQTFVNNTTHLNLNVSTKTKTGCTAEGITGG